MTDFDLTVGQYAIIGNVPTTTAHNWKYDKTPMPDHVQAVRDRIKQIVEAEHDRQR